MSKLPAKIIAIANQKGGVGKTTTAVNLGAGLAAAEKRVLIVDGDAQANATSSLGVPGDRSEKINLYRTLIGELSFEGSLLATDLACLKLMPAHADLVGMEVEMLELEDRNFKLKRLLEPAREEFDFIFIDCPPALSLLTINALTAADSVLIPLQAEYLAMEGLSHLLRTLELIKTNYNENLAIEGVLLTMHDQRNRLAREVEREVRDHFKSEVFKTVIPRNVRLSESPSFGKPLILYDIQSKGAAAYLKLAGEFLNRQVSQSLSVTPVGG